MLLAGMEVVSGGAAKMRVATDGSAPAEIAAELLRQHVVLLTGTALPASGTLPPLRFSGSAMRGYEIREAEGGLAIEGSDLVRAAYEILEEWGCDFDRTPVVASRRERLELQPRQAPRQSDLWIDGSTFEASMPGSGFMHEGIDAPAALLQQARDRGLATGVASTSFDDFLPPSLHAEHPEWFALRDGARVPRGNFALTNREARTAYLDAVEGWLAAHLAVDRLALRPEVTTVWCEESVALGEREAYALLWRDASARFPDRTFEILATGPTLRPPEGGVPGNIVVRLRPGAEASGLQGIAGQAIEVVVRAWEARGARVLLEIDAAPASWCRLPWPCHDAIRANAARFREAALRGGRRDEARLFLDPRREPRREPWQVALDERAREVASHGDLRDTGRLFLEEEAGLAFRVGAVERILLLAKREEASIDERRAAATDAWFGYRALVREFPEGVADRYRRQRAREFELLLHALLPDGAEQRVGPALVRESPHRLRVETDILRLTIDPRIATVVGVARKTSGQWRTDLELEEGRFFSVIALGNATERGAGAVDYSAPDPTRLTLFLTGSLRPGGPRWESELMLEGGSGAVRQRASIASSTANESRTRIVSGCRWHADALDRWICPAHATEGRIDGVTDLRIALPMPAGTLLYCRKGEFGLGLAARLPRGGLLSLTGTSEPTLAAIGVGATIELDWILFVEPGELGH